MNRRENVSNGSGLIDVDMLVLFICNKFYVLHMYLILRLLITYNLDVAILLANKIRVDLVKKDVVFRFII